jgi:triacylglycerol lipase
MSREPKPLPRPTLSRLIPPSVDHVYFQDATAYPFQPRASGFSLVNAWWLAEASLLAYGDEPFVVEKLAGFGLVESPGIRVRSFLGVTRGTQCFVLDSERFAIVAFRGTRIESFPDPILKWKMRLLNRVDLATDLDFRLDPTEQAHSGFIRALDEVWDELRDHLEGLAARALDKTFWFTGHSLGAALATLAAGRCGRHRPGGLYTFGSPRVGNENYRGRFPVPGFRFVNNTDIVPHLPPRGLLADYTHLGVLKFLDHDGGILSDPTRFEILESYVQGHWQAITIGRETFTRSSLAEAGLALLDAIQRKDAGDLGGKFEALDLDSIPFAALVDHMPRNYAVKVWNALVADRAAR